MLLIILFAFALSGAVIESSTEGHIRDIALLMWIGAALLSGVIATARYKEW